VSIRITEEVWEHSEAEGTKRLVLLVLADNADDERRYAWPSVPRIARRVRRSERAVQRVLRELVEEGELRVVREGGTIGGKRRATLYAIRPYGPGSTGFVAGDNHVGVTVSSTSNDSGRSATSTASRVPVEQLEPRLQERLPAVMERLSELCRAKGAEPPDPERVAYRLRKYPDRDHVHAADSLLEWMTEGRGANVRLSSPYQRWDDWLRTSPDELGARRQRRSNADRVEENLDALARLKGELEARGE
jgi:hypothetical protein